MRREERSTTLAEFLSFHPISPHGENKELFFLRCLLFEKPGKSFKDMRTVEGVTYDTYYKQACIALGLCKDDKEQEEVMTRCGGKMIRQVFASLLVFCTPQECPAFLERYLKPMAEDFEHTLGLQDREKVSPIVRATVLSALKDLLEQHGRSLESFELPLPDYDLIERPSPMVITHQGGDRL